MKRLSILATLATVALLGIAALGAGSASADVLCNKVVGGSYDCPTQNTYGVGAEFHATNHGAISLKRTGGSTIFSCGTSELDMTVTNAGGAGYQYPEVDVSNLTLSNCYGGPASFTSDGGGLFTPYSLSSLKGLFHWSGEKLETAVKFPWDENQEVKCSYDIVGTGTLAGAKTEGEFDELTKIKFNAAPTQRIKENIPWGFLCPEEPLFSGQYDFLELEWPVGIYLTRS